MNLELSYFGDPVLREKAKEIPEITDEIKELAKAMCKKMEECNGTGLAAPQVGHSLRLFVARFADYRLKYEDWLKEPITICINPKLSKPGVGLVTMSEACLSLKTIRGDVTRPDAITLEALDLEGKPFKMELKDYIARIAMHENDHLNGVLHIDRMDPKDRKNLDPEINRLKKETKKKLKNR